MCQAFICLPVVPCCVRSFENAVKLMLLLADQVQNLPLGNESWMSTERELVAAERALARLPLVDG